MARWMSKLGVVVVAWGMLEGCGAPVEDANTEASSGERTSTLGEQSEALGLSCHSDAVSTQRMQSNLPPAEPGEPSVYALSPDSFVNFRGQLYFAAYAGHDYLSTLWRSDGTPTGTVAVKEVTGLGSLTPASSRLFFQAYDATHGEELWVSDGTPAGTRILKDLTPGAESSTLVGITALGERLVFFRQVKDPNTSATSSELWTSDGTTAGTVRLLAALPQVLNAGERLTLGGELLFFTYDAQGTALWKTDGTKAGTVRVKGVAAPDKATYNTHLSGGWAFFYVGGNGTQEVWKSDGTKAGTQPLHTYDSTLYPTILGALGSSLYMATTSPTTQLMTVSRLPLAGGAEVAVATLPNAYADQDYAPPYVGSVSAVPGGKHLYFALTINGRTPRDSQLWVTDGTTAGTRLVHRPLSLSDEYNSLIYAAADDLVFFTGYDNTAGIEPWVSDGTPEGSRLLKDLVPGGESSYPYGFLRVGSRVFTSTADGVNGGQVWSTQLRTTCAISP